MKDGAWQDGFSQDINIQLFNNVPQNCSTKMSVVQLKRMKPIMQTPKPNVKTTIEVSTKWYQCLTVHL